MHQRWLPNNFRLHDGLVLGRLLSSNCDWQIYRTGKSISALIARSCLVERWVDLNLVADTAFTAFTFGKQRFQSLVSGHEQRLEAVYGASSPNTKEEGMAFALSVRETRKIDQSIPLHDAIYVERLSRLLPSWTVSQAVSDEQILGRWLTGGVTISATSLRHLSNLLGWLKKQDIVDLVEAAGFFVPNTSSAVRSIPNPGINIISSQQEKNNQHTDSSPLEESPRFRLPGRPSLEHFFTDHIIDIIQNPDRYAALGINFPTAFVLHGPPGCGKTFAVTRLAEYLDWPIFHIDSNSVGSPFIHETSKKIGQIFDQASDSSPSIIIIDEMEAYLSDRLSHGTTATYHVEEVSEFLRRIPEATLCNVLVIGMTNRIEMIDSAVLRRGRFDKIIEVSEPCHDDLLETIRYLLSTMPIEKDLDLHQVVKPLQGRPLSDSAFVVREAARLAARAKKNVLDTDSLVQALQCLPPSISRKQPIGFTQE